MSDLFGNHIVGFSTRWLIYIRQIALNIKIYWKRDYTIHIAKTFSHMHIVEFSHDAANF